MTTTEITLIGIFTIEAIRLIMTIVKEMKEDEKMPFADNLKKEKDIYG
jgi:hypothetical protein